MARKTNIEINGKKYAKVTRTVGHKADGTPIKKQFYGTGIKEANEKADEYMNKIQSGFSTDFEKITVSESLKKWLFNIKLNQVKPSTFVTYEGNFRNYIEPSSISSLQVFKVKKMHIQELYNQLFKDGHSSEKIKAIQKLLHGYFEYAIEEGYLLKNPCNKVVIPKNTQEKSENKKIDCFSVEEIKLIQNQFKNHKFEVLINSAIYTGMREGELLALKWKNVDLDNQIIHVDESVKTVAVFDSDGHKETKTLFLEPKTQKSIRDIPLPNILVDQLKTIPKTSEFVFTNDNKAVTHKALYLAWKNNLNKINIPYRKFHALRHTYATTLLSKGIDIKTVSELMGHYDISITQVYLHSLPENKKQAVKIFDNL